MFSWENIKPAAHNGKARNGIWSVEVGDLEEVDVAIFGTNNEALHTSQGPKPHTAHAHEQSVRYIVLGLNPAYGPKQSKISSFAIHANRKQIARNQIHIPLFEVQLSGYQEVMINNRQSTHTLPTYCQHREENMPWKRELQNTSSRKLNHSYSYHLIATPFTRHTCGFHWYRHKDRAALFQEPAGIEVGTGNSEGGYSILPQRAVLTVGPSGSGTAPREQICRLQTPSGSDSGDSHSTIK